MLRKVWAIALLSHVFISQAFAEEIVANQAAEQSVRSQMGGLTTDVGSRNRNATANTNSAQYFLEQTEKQKKEIEALEAQLRSFPQELATRQQNIKQYKEELESDTAKKFRAFSLDEIIQKQSDTQTQLQQTQTELSELDEHLANSRNLFSSNQRMLERNNTRVQEITRLKNNNTLTDAVLDRLNAELAFIDLNNRFNTLLNSNFEKITQLDEVKKAEASARQLLLQQRLSLLQDALNQKRLEESEKKAKQVENTGTEIHIQNALLLDEVEENRKLSQFLIKQTQALNELSQDDLRTKSVLEGLAQTQRNVKEQISALQGTLVLSKVINQQMQSLPEEIYTSLANTIANVRVQIFEYSQQRDKLYNTETYIAEATIAHEEPLTDEEHNSLTKILQERQKLLDEIIKALNGQLNLAMNIENTQQQISTVSVTLQRDLRQQGFWVNSNNPMGLDWIKAFPALAIKEIRELTSFIAPANLSANWIPTLIFISFFFSIAGVINWKKSAIKDRLSTLAGRVNKLNNDSHWVTPEAMFWTIVLTLPSTLIFFTIYTVFGFFLLKNPIAVGAWGLQITLYWFLFAILISLLRQNGLAYHHFGMPQESNRIFQRIIKESIWIIGLLLISSIPSQMESIGYLNDVIGQLMSIVALALCLFVVRPLLDRGIKEYQNAKTEDGTIRNVSLFNLLRVVLVIAPISLIGLIVFGYYYTSVYLISHLIDSYFAILFWVFGRYFAYRSVTISARRMAYRRLQEKRQQLREQNSDLGKDEKAIKLSVVNQQILRVTDLIGWVVLIVLLYMIWSDLISVAYHLESVILFESDDGTKVESITLLNLMRALLYMLITYVIVKNIAGILEVAFFSRIRLSKGTPQTITTIFIYITVAIGGIFAFSALGISWGKIQWIFTALSVGLGFGVREIFGSVVSGSILLFERPIRVGDKVTVGQYTGIITRIRLRSTTLLNSDNMEVVLPNQAFVTDRFINWTLNNTITRLQIFINVVYDTDLNLMHRLLYQAVSEAPKVLADPKMEINMLHFGENALEHELLVFVGELGDRSETTNFLYYRINQLFQENGIRFAFKQLDLHLPQGTSGLN